MLTIVLTFENFAQEAKAFLDGVDPKDPEALAAAFVWLRYARLVGLF